MDRNPDVSQSKVASSRRASLLLLVLQFFAALITRGFLKTFGVLLHCCTCADMFNVSRLRWMLKDIAKNVVVIVLTSVVFALFWVWPGGIACPMPPSWKQQAHMTSLQLTHIKSIRWPGHICWMEDDHLPKQTLHQGQQPVARMPHLARQTISNGTQKLQVLHINFVMIHKKYYWPWLRVVSRVGPGSGLSLSKCFGPAYKNFLEHSL